MQSNWTLGHNLSVILIPQPNHLRFVHLPLSHCLCETCSSLKAIFGFAALLDGVLHLVVHLLDITTSPGWSSSPKARKAKGVHRESAKLNYTV